MEVTIKIQKKSGYIEKVLPSLGLASGYLEDLSESREYWMAEVYVEGTFFYRTNKFLVNPKFSLPKEFNFKNDNGDDIRLIIKANREGYTIIDVWFNGNKIANNSDAFVKLCDKYKDRVYLQFRNINNGRITMLCICDLNKEQNMTVNQMKQNREISNILFEMGQDNDILLPYSLYSLK